jgi:site-specific recombinase XerD
MKKIPTRSASRMDLRLRDAWLARQTSANTRAAYRMDLEIFERWCAQNKAIPLRADAATVTAFQLARQAAGDSDATLRRRWSSLSSFYRFAIDAEMTDVNPVAGARRPLLVAGVRDATPVLTGSAVDAYLSTAAALDPRLDALVSLLAFDGLKLGEALALNVNDITGRPPTVALTVRRRGAAHRLILGVQSARAVRRCVGRRRSEPLFTSERAAAPEAAPRRLTRFGADHLIRQLTEHGDERVTSNAFRRFYVASNHYAQTET